jgi:hypothetical protein
MLEALEQPVATRVRRTARAFASLPASAGLVLLGATVPQSLVVEGIIVAVAMAVS